MGPVWNLDLSINVDGTFQFHMEAQDSGSLSTANGQWEFTSNWVWNGGPPRVPYRMTSPDTIQLIIPGFAAPSELRRVR